MSAETCERCPKPPAGTCCSSHDKRLCHECYRRTHFVEVCFKGCEDCVAEGLPVNLPSRVRASALADAGLLLMPGGETHEEWAIRVDRAHPSRSEKPGDVMTHLGVEKSRRCREVWGGWTPISRGITTWPDGTVLTGPWIEVPS